MALEEGSLCQYTMDALPEQPRRIALVSSFANISLALNPPLSRPLRRAAIAWPMRGLRLAAGFHFQGKEQADRILQVIKVLFIRRKILG